MRPPAFLRVHHLASSPLKSHGCLPRANNPNLFNGFRWIAILALSFCCSIGRSQEGSTAELPRKVSANYIKNLIQVTQDVYSGGVPEGQQAFEELKRLGIKTVLSVDGMKPQVAMAEAAGLTYVHLPHGYDGISEDRRLDIAKAILIYPKPIFIHCHHGKHRSPAATASSCITLGWLTSEQGNQLLKIAGTNPNYRGLYRAVDDSQPVDKSAIQQRSVQFRSVTELAPLTETMVEMDDLMEKLSMPSKKDSSESDSEKVANSALLLAELYTELLRTTAPNSKESGYFQLLKEGESIAVRLEKDIRSRSVDTASLLEKLKSNCSDCHKRYRDNATK